MSDRKNASLTFTPCRTEGRSPL